MISHAVGRARLGRCRPISRQHILGQLGRCPHVDGLLGQTAGTGFDGGLVPLAYLGKQAINDFFDWIDSLMCGIDLFDDRAYQIPTSFIDPVSRQMRPALRSVGK